MLCTSHANVKRFAEVLRERTDHDILEQGEREAGRLIEAFVDDEASVLVGTRSFWAGIDAAGAACVLVVIDRIPFPAPDEPLHAARGARAEQRGARRVRRGRPAGRRARPRAGRRPAHPRRPTDRGVVAVLDPRLAVRAYRKQLLAAMPPFRRSVDLADACGLLAELAARAPAPASGRAAMPSASAADVDPRHLRTDLSSAESVVIRNLVRCDVCDAAVTERCHDVNGTSAFLHEGRVRAATV